MRIFPLVLVAMLAVVSVSLAADDAAQGSAAGAAADGQAPAQPNAPDEKTGEPAPPPEHVAEEVCRDGQPSKDGVPVPCDTDGHRDGTCTFGRGAQAIPVPVGKIVTGPKPYPYVEQLSCESWNGEASRWSTGSNEQKQEFPKGKPVPMSKWKTN